MNNTEKEALIKKYIAAYNAINIEGMLECVTEDVVFRNVMGGTVNMEIYGKNSLQELGEKTKGLFSQREQSVTSYTHSDDKTRVDIHFEAVFAMGLPNGVQKGQKMAVDGYSEYEFRDGLISVIADCS